MVIIRNDDVSPNSNKKHIETMYSIIREFLTDVEIWSCVSPICKSAPNGSVYPELPLRNHDLPYFYNVDYRVFWNITDIGAISTIVSHGLLHIDHTKVSRDAQKLSIMTSCSMLGTKIFVPPFSQHDANTEDICNREGIRLVKSSDGWKSLESEPFDPNHPLWFFHSWRFTPETFREIFANACEKLGQLP